MKPMPFLLKKNNQCSIAQGLGGLDPVETRSAGMMVEVPLQGIVKFSILITHTVKDMNNITLYTE